MVNNSLDNSSQILKDFQLTSDIAAKSTLETGLRMAQAIQSTLVGNTSYFFLRNARFLLNRQMANGRYNVQLEFQDRMGFDGKINYANLMWLPLHIVNTIISKRVSAWMARNEKIQVKAKDSNSVKVKNDQYKYAEFILNNKEKLNQLQQASGIPQIGQDQFVPEDKDELDLWASEFNHLPEEIKYELGINGISEESGLYDVLKEKILHDSAEVGLVALFTDMNSKGEIYDQYIRPENVFYSDSEYPDFRDTTWRGYCFDMKVKDFRRKYGKQFGGRFTEQQIWEIAATGKEYQLVDKLSWTSWNNDWSMAFYRPYDECNISCILFQVRSIDEDGYSMKVGSDGKLVAPEDNNNTTVGKMYGGLKDKLTNQKNGSVLKSAISNVINQQKGKLKPEHIAHLKNIHSSINKNADLSLVQIEGYIKSADSVLQNVISESEQVRSKDYNIYQGVYAKDANQILEWGLKKNQIKPQDPKKIYQADFSISLYMYQNYGMRNLAIPEKVEEPFKNMCLLRLKIQQLVATAIPSGWAIDQTALDSIDYGLADKNKDVDHEKLFAQTGRLYYRGLDAEGNRVPVPISELRNSGFVDQMNAYIALFGHHYQVLKSQLGEDPDLQSQAATPRVSEGNIQTAMVQGDYATDYMYDSYLYVMEESARKKACLLNDSVTYGSQVYAHILGEEDVKGRDFSVEAKMLPTDREVAELQNTMNQAIASNPKLSTYLDVFKIMRIAKEDVKLAELYYSQATKRMIKTETAIAQQNQQQNAKDQIDSAQAAEAAKLNSLKEELRLKDLSDDKKNRNELKKIALQGAFQVMASSEADVQPEWKPVISELIHNIMIPLLSDNIEHTKKLGEAIAANQQEQQEQAESPEQQQQEQMQGQEQPMEAQEQNQPIPQQ